MAGPWEKFKSPEAASAGPWAKFKKEELPAKPSTQGSAALEGAGNGLTLGYLAQAQAATEPLTNKIGDMVMGTDVSGEDNSTYVQRRDENLARQLQLQKDNPKTYLGSQVAGGLVGGLAVPGATLGKGAALAARLKAAVGTGAAMRALQNPGDQAGVVDPVQGEQRLEAVSNPGAVAMDVALPMAGPALRAAGSKLGSGAESLAFSALGPNARAIKQNMSNDKMSTIGRDVLDSGAFGVLPVGWERLSKRLGDLKRSAGEKLGQTVEGMAQKETGPKVGLSREQIAQELEGDLINPNTDLAGVSGKNADMLERLQNFKRGGLPEGATGPINSELPLLEAEMKKRAAGQQVNWDRVKTEDVPQNDVFHKALYGKLAQGVEEKGDELALKTGFDVGAFKQQKSTYGSLAAAEAISSNKANRHLANRMLSPSDYGAGMAGTVLGGMTGHDPASILKNGVYGAGAALANKFVRTYGSQLAARGLNTGSGLANTLGTGAVKMSENPVAQEAVWNTLYRKSQEDKKK